jgi:hypothetical protein
MNTYGFPGCTPKQRDAHYQWCYNHGHQCDWKEYQKLSAEGKLKRGRRHSNDSRPDDISRQDWQRYNVFRRRKAATGQPVPTLDEYLSKYPARGVDAQELKAAILRMLEAIRNPTAAPRT